MRRSPRGRETHRRTAFGFLLGLLVLFLLRLQAPGGLRGEEARPGRAPEDIAEASRRSVVIIAAAGRTGDPRGVGSGFVVGANGLIATNLHVIGEGRAFTVQLADGTSAAPRAVVAVDRPNDLAIIEVDRSDLPALDLAGPEEPRPGRAVLCVGNPLGLVLSVSSGTIAGMRVIEGRRLIQVALPIEPGSSGSPLIDMDGRVVGVVAIKSTGTLGFAVPAAAVRDLLAKPRPVPISRWLTIGALDPEEWRIVLGGEWRQRAGKIIATGLGDGFGGRSLCLSGAATPGDAFELSVDVRLESESGAAGLVFHSDGDLVHHGFYPTGGALRLTRFEGPDVFHWTILETVPSDAYRPGEWNTIRVSVDGPRIICRVNGAEVIRAEDAALAPGKVGLVKFREPGAEFRRFRIARELPREAGTEGVASRVEEIISRLAGDGKVPPDLVEAAAALGEEGIRSLLGRAGAMERRAGHLRSLAEAARLRGVERKLKGILDAPEGDVDLLRAALHVAMLDNGALEPEPYIEMAERMAAEAGRRAGADAAAERKLESLVEYLFGELGFRGSVSEYYHRSNSYLNEVLDDREGIPITLSVVFLEVGRRMGLRLAGVAAPRHFLVRWDEPDGEARLIDVFAGGKMVTRAEADALTGVELDEHDLASAPARLIIHRMLRNLIGAAQAERDAAGMLRYLDAILAIDEGSGPDRWLRAVTRFRNGDRAGARSDLDLLRERAPPGVDPAEVEELREILGEK